MPDTSRNTPPDCLPEVTTRNRIARHLTEGFSTSFPADIWRYLATAFADIPALSAEITRLRAELAGTRLDCANLAAAGLATIAAQYDGERDPLSYLRDELRAQGHAIRGHA
jgi:serine/threonine protein kinase HipA of HipAB toxin-antitoxin module